MKQERALWVGRESNRMAEERQNVGEPTSVEKTLQNQIASLLNAEWEWFSL